MSAAFWLLLYLAPLLGLTAVIFGWLGWLWRGQDLKSRAPLVAEQGSEAVAEPSEVNVPPAPEAPAPASGDVAKDEELRRLREELSAAQQRVRLSED